MRLPNLRKILVPDPGYILADIDLAGADAQVVAWEADDDDLKNSFRTGADVHQRNADLLGVSRPMAKRWVHGTNYGGGTKTMASSCGITIHECEVLQQRWFLAHPGIRRWHDRTRKALQHRMPIKNRFGYRSTYFGRPEENFRAALAWLPQSTVACVTNRAWVILEEMGVEVLLQVHDSLVFQVPLREWPTRKEEIYHAIQIPIPYPGKLVIPWGLATSQESWGEVKEEDW